MSDSLQHDAAIRKVFPRYVETARLILRPYEQTDAAQLLRALAAESGRLDEILAAPVMNLRTMEDAERLIAQLEADWQAGRQYVISVWDKHQGNLVGECYLGPCGPDSVEAEIGIFLFRNYEAQGLAQEALEACIREAGRSMKLSALHYRCDVDNERSRKLAMRLGFTDTGERLSTRLRRDATRIGTFHFKLDLTI